MFCDSEEVGGEDELHQSSCSVLFDGWIVLRDGKYPVAALAACFRNDVANLLVRKAHCWGRRAHTRREVALHTREVNGNKLLVAHGVLSQTCNFVLLAVMDARLESLAGIDHIYFPL